VKHVIPAKDLPLEHRVSCDCPAIFHLRVGLAETNSLDAVHACVRCGEITFTEVLWEHVHHNTYHPHGRREKKLSVELRAWLDRWPRVVEGENQTDYTFLPAHTRCTDEKELAGIISPLRQEQLALPRGRRLHHLGRPAEPSPADLPQKLDDYRQLWHAVQLSPTTDPATLMRYANPQLRPTSALATDCLLQRSDAAYVVGKAAAVSDGQVRQTVYSIVSEEPSLLPIALTSLLSWVDGVAGCQGKNADGQILEDLLNFLAKQKSCRSRIVPALEAAKSRLCRAAFELSRKFTETIHALNGEPPLPISPTPWFFNS
jgi:hypothetical protein